MDVRRDYPPGGRGTTPQDTFAILNGTSVAGRLADFVDDHLPPKTRETGLMGRPAIIADAGYFTDDEFLLVMNGAVGRMQPDVMRSLPTAKTLGGYDPRSE